ncbi:MAG: RNA polymerase factor sigma-54 [Clostridiales Family XIII bacterium]|jgi:RNA polymerase sigma-54 factor|nr:RNA polymerase factor sigma-54 [Clostridiales Family XIII bacterium]
MKLEFDISLEQKQTLQVTPELIQAIKILQYNAQELDTFTREQLQENPLLEIEPPEDEERQDDIPEVNGVPETRGEKVRGDEDFDWSEYLNERGIDDISYKHFGSVPVPADSEGLEYERAPDESESLANHLLRQLDLADISDRKRRIGEYIIESLDENGYLAPDEDEIAELLSEDPARVRKVLSFIQTFDPPGIAAANLAESLLLQIRSMPDIDEADAAAAECMVTKHLSDLAANRMREIARCVKRPVADVQRIADMIRELDPKPGRRYGGGQPQYIIPDVIVERDGDGYTVSLNAITSPQLYVSPYYREVLACEEKGSETSKFLSERLNSALWLIKSIEQRNQTIYNVVRAIVNHQAAFMDGGEKYLKPLTLKKIADAVGVHESTVSRTVNGKYMQTPRGIYELKYFFGSGVRSESPDGVSSGGIKALIKEMIADEDVSSPLSDQDIADSLVERGIDISRRTVAKYREDAGIPSSSGRRRYT